MNKEAYVQPALVKHELLRDITAGRSGGSSDCDNKPWKKKCNR